METNSEKLFVYLIILPCCFLSAYNLITNVFFFAHYIRLERYNQFDKSDLNQFKKDIERKEIQYFGDPTNKKNQCIDSEIAVNAQLIASSSKQRIKQRALYDIRINSLLNKWESGIKYRKLCIEFSSLLIVWLCLAKHHHRIVDIFYLVSDSV